MVLIERAFRQAKAPSTLLTLEPFDPPGPAVSFQLLEAAVLDPGGPRWETLDRPRRQSVLEWQGRDPLRQSVVLMFSGARLDERSKDLASVTPQVNQLHELAMPSSGAEPPLLWARGPVYGNWSGYAWRIESLTPGVPRRNQAGEVCQVSYEVTLVRHLSTDIISSNVSPAKAAEVAIGATSGAPAPTSGRTYTVVRGDSLSRIAQRQLGSAGKWPEIAKANGLRDPNQLKVGQVLRLP